MLNVLESMNFTANDDDIVAIIGESGCGKTTLLNALAGIIKPSMGSLLLNSAAIDPRVHRIGYIPQGYGLLPWKTVEQNCLLPFKIKRQSIGHTERDRLEHLMDRLNISGLNDRFPDTLSGGQNQRTAIVRSFLMRPELLLMDEAFSSLDAITKEEAEELFLEIWHEQQMTAFFVTHSIEEALYMGKKIIIMPHKSNSTLKTIDNVFFYKKDAREQSDYWALFTEIKEQIKGGCALL